MAKENAQPSDLLTQYRQVFCGAQDRFVLHVPPFTTNERGKLSGKWAGFAQYGKVSFPKVPDGFEKGDYVPCGTEQFKAHLNGEYILALSPLVAETNKGKKNVCSYGIIDIDVVGKDYTGLINRMYQDGFRFAAFRSKSGGLHIYFLFGNYEAAADVRVTLKRIVDTYGLPKLYKSEKTGNSAVEIFPEHDERKPGVKDKGICLPWFNCTEGGNCPNNMWLADGTLVGIVKGLPLLIQGTKLVLGTSLKEMNGVLDSLPYNDAPYCVQAALLSGQLYDGSCRNDFIFTTALYLKLKYGKDGFQEEMLAEANEYMAEPLEQHHIRATYNSAQGRDFPILGQCKKEPMCTFCDKKLCKERMYGAVKKDNKKENTASNIEFGQMYWMQAETPYYLLEARIAGSEDEFKMLRIDSVDALYNQDTVSKECFMKLRCPKWEVKKQVWMEQVRELGENAKDREVPMETDTTELSDLRRLFNRYLTHRQTQSSDAFYVTLRQVYYEAGKFYFQTDGLKDYLRISKYQGRQNLREQLIAYGCQEAILEYTKGNGQRGEVACWCKEEDALLKKAMTYFDEVAEKDAEILKKIDLGKKDGDDEGRETKAEKRRF